MIEKFTTRVMEEITSGFGILDVSRGRKQLRQRIKRGEKIPVVINAVIDDLWGDDGISQEFGLTVTGVTEVVQIERCKNAERYKAKRAPTCGCKTCNDKWKQAQVFP